MIPEFTADASLSRPRTRSFTSRPAALRAAAIVPQQLYANRALGGPDETVSEWGGTGSTITCPGCAQHACGFLGLHTCLTCC